ncbi:ABC-type organic anion transporter ABCA8-like isoform X2 [Hyla sarda]|uniref:ABC-type organic anion transporter ABCA8-like isoform X2 n=1 Tax=Hyla sarda TaxID=327740 RepID=UPI0024C44812|nr:ABC-type organic anion transporter ABCA8-like isoform X2 [Hyla sarda]
MGNNSKNRNVPLDPSQLGDKNGMRHEALFFLRSSYWSREKDFPPKFPTRGRAESRNEENIEKVPDTFQGREVIRIHNVKKTYRGEEKVEALRGLDFDIYEGQITALLGHSGAGKTTLLNILSGMCSPTTGSAFIYNYNLSDMNHLEQIHNMVGFCPQFDVKFDPLTVKENLKVFAHIKGVTSGSADQEVQKVICDLQLTDVQNTEASELSGGQKRKLSLGIAILGDPLVLLLDEPTAGLDPCSRHHVWAKLKERKGDRVTVLSTQFMDEADILADQKAVISSGRLKCMGSSLFLKRKWGIGYHLRMLVSPSCDPKVIMSLVQQHVPSAKLSAKREQEMTFTLPFQNMDAFPDLFSHLDGLVGGDILSYGVAMTTLDDVFLKLEGEAEIEGGDYEVFSQEIMSEQDRDNLNSEMEDSVQLMSDSGKATVSGMALWSQQVMAIARIRFLKLKYDMKSFRALLLLIFLFLIPLITLFTIILNIKGSFMWELRPDLYFLRPGDRGHRYFSSLVINNNTGSPIEDFIVAVKAQDIVVEVIDGPYDTNMTTYKGAIEISGKDQDYRFTIVGNPRAHNALPVLVNIISNSLLKSFQSNERIQTWSNPVRQGDTEYIYIFFMSLVFMAFGSGMAPHFAMSSIEDTRNKARSLLRISGLYPSTYWCGQALVDVPLHCFLLFLMIAILFTFNHKILLDYWVASLLIIGVLGYSAAIVLYVYVISFLFRRGKSHHDLWLFFFIMPTFIPLFMMEFVDLGPTISFLYMFFFPPNALIGLLFSIGGVEINKLHKEDELSSDLHLCVLVSFVHLFLFWGILWFLEWRYGTRSLTRDPVFRTIRRKVMIKPNPEDVADAEEEVLAEREMVKHAKASKHLEATPAIIVDSLRKEFKIKSGVFSFKKKKRVAIKNISFCVKKGEVLGLLGPNGAGKTTSIFTLAGDITATAGEVVLCDASEDSTTFLGYCCQDNPLWPDITVKEHLEIYAAVKGMKKNDGALAIRRYIGTIQQLKSKFGKGYYLEIKMKDSQTVDVVHQEITRLFPDAARQDRFSTFLVYKIPMGNVKSLSQAFLHLEEAKRMFSIDEYSFSQSTLEQVFLELMKEQEMEDIDTTFRWTQMPTENM